MSDQALINEWTGRVLPRSFTAGYVILSYVVSYVGAWTTLELINRRTAAKGSYNWYVRNMLSTSYAYVF